MFCWFMCPLGFVQGGQLFIHLVRTQIKLTGAKGNFCRDCFLGAGSNALVSSF